MNPICHKIVVCKGCKERVTHCVCANERSTSNLEMFARRARFGWDYWGDESLGTVELDAA